MKKIVLFITFFVLTSNCLLCQDIYSEVIDSVLTEIKELIIEDMAKDSIKVYDRNRPWLGVSYVLEVAFDEKRVSCISHYKRPGIVRAGKWKIKHRIKENHFIHCVLKNGVIPYSDFEYLRYKFILAPLVKENFADPLYCEYSFKITSDKLTIIDKKVEPLVDEQSIIDKVNSDW